MEPRQRKPITEHEGKKYLRAIQSAVNHDTVEVDVYCVLKAFGVTCPAKQHAIKKLLTAGQRNKGNELDDLLGAEAALSRAIEMHIDQCASKFDSISSIDDIDRWPIAPSEAIPPKSGRDDPVRLLTEYEYHDGSDKIPEECYDHPRE